MTFNSIDATNRLVDPNIESHLPSGQLPFLHEYEERLSGILISAKEIEAAMDDCADFLVQEYSQEKVSMITGVYVLTGARVVFSDLSSRLFERGMTVVEDNTDIGRYGSNLEGGVPRINLDVKNVKPKDHVLACEDVIDEGITFESLAKRLELIKPESLKLFSLLFKPDKYEGDLRVHYSSFKVADHWVVGKGMDLSVQVNHQFRPLYRELPFVAVANPEYLLKTGQINEEKASQLHALIHYET
jgi:hypoxanthine phosphoribosyltransferase